MSNSNSVSLSTLSFNGSIVPLEQAKIPVNHIGFTYGWGVYELIKVRNRKLFFPEHHLQRLAASAKIINLPLEPDEAKLRFDLEELVRNTEGDSFNVKILVVGSMVKGSKKGKASERTSDVYMFSSAPKFIDRSRYKEGVKVITLPGERTFPQAKTLSMLTSYLALQQAQAQDAYDALLVNREGKVMEGTRSNFFCVKDNVVYTPPVHEVLPGVTRATLLEVLSQNGITVQEKSWKEYEILSGIFDGFFLTNTSAKVLPVSQVNDTSFDIPQVVREIMRCYNTYLEKYADTQNRIAFHAHS
jgi:branched-chain amino acid aminotransferase